MIVEDASGVKTPKIFDFGIAKRQHVDSSLTQTGEIFGTPIYMSPEQCLGNVVDERTDVYSFGCMLYEALSGSPPFVGENAVKTIFKHLNDQPISLNKVSRQRISVSLEKFVASCLEKNPDHRPQTAKQCASDLRAIAAGQKPQSIKKNFAHSKKALLNAASKISLVGILILAVFGGLLLLGLSMSHEAPSAALVRQAEQKLAEDNTGEAVRLSRAAVALSEKEQHSDIDRMRFQESLVQSLARNGEWIEAAVSCRKVAVLAEKVRSFLDLETYALRAADYERSEKHFDQAAQDCANAIVAERRLVGADSPRLVLALQQAARFAYRTNVEQSKNYLEEIDRIARLNNAKGISHVDRLTNTDWLVPIYTRLHQQDKAIELINDVTARGDRDLATERERGLFARLMREKDKLLKSQKSQ